MTPKSTCTRSQQGAAAVEFAIVVTAFVMILTMIVGFAHWIYTHEMIADATRVGARVAVVCDLNDGAIKNVMQSRLPQLGLAADQISIAYFPAGCNKASCQWVQVSLSGVTYAPWIPFLPGAVAIPSFTTSLPRESLESVNADGQVNPVCS